MTTESIEKLLEPKLHIPEEKTVTVLVAALLLLPLFTPPTAACIPYCPPCYWWDGSGCRWDCSTGEFCCDGTCCSTGTTCCHGSCCHPEDCETCQGEHCKSTCDLETQHCCNGTCCEWEQECCDGTCCDPDNCKVCQDGSCVDRCNADECRQCDGQGSCTYQCDEETHVCCDGTCKPRCENGFETGECDAHHGDPFQCPECALLIGCGISTTKVYSDNRVYSDCSGGCPGECGPQSTLCYTEYYCDAWLWPAFLCKSNFPQPGKSCQVELIAGCFQCYQGIDIVGYSYANYTACD